MANEDSEQSPRVTKKQSTRNGLRPGTMCVIQRSHYRDQKYGCTPNRQTVVQSPTELAILAGRVGGCVEDLYHEGGKQDESHLVFN
jgi:hypothetical protein